jgi:hypothetical protein
MTAEKHQPIACTLSGAALQDRRASIAALARDALRGTERNDLTLRLRFGPLPMANAAEGMIGSQAIDLTACWVGGKPATARASTAWASASRFVAQ